MIEPKCDVHLFSARPLLKLFMLYFSNFLLVRPKIEGRPFGWPGGRIPEERAYPPPKSATAI